MAGRSLPVQPGNDTRLADTRFDLFDHQDGIRRRVPPNWMFPKLGLMHMYVLWHCGNQAQRVAAIKLWDATDVATLPSKRVKATLSEIRRVMKIIDCAATENGLPPKKFMTNNEVISCFNAGKYGLKIPMETPTGKRRNLEKMSWRTVMKNLPKVRPRRQ